MQGVGCDMRCADHRSEASLALIERPVAGMGLYSFLRPHNNTRPRAGKTVCALRKRSAPPILHGSFA